jgi:hypothetical protein
MSLEHFVPRRARNIFKVGRTRNGIGNFWKHLLSHRDIEPRDIQPVPHKNLYTVENFSSLTKISALPTC